MLPVIGMCYSIVLLSGGFNLGFKRPENGSDWVLWAYQIILIISPLITTLAPVLIKDRRTVGIVLFLHSLAFLLPIAYFSYVVLGVNIAAILP
jgi:hypothetical protein